VEEACSFLDLNKIKIVTLDLKDANEMLMANRSRDLLWAALTGAKPYVPSGITTSKNLLQDAMNPADSGTPWPWPSLTALTYGKRPGLYGIGAGVGIGKTEFFHELIHHIAYHEKQPVGVFLLEEAPQRTLKILAGKSLNLPLHKPDTVYDPKDVEEHIRKYHDPRELVYFFDHKGSRDWDTIFSQCKYLAAVNEVRNIIIDPLTAIISHEENTDRALHKLMADMAVLTQAPYNCAVYFSSHLNEPPRDKIPHEEGGRVKESHFTGSRAMIRFSNYILALERNKQDPDVIARNTTTVRVLKDRDFGVATGETFEIYYNPTTGRYLEEAADF
jgi:twinkle protein